MKFHPEGNTVDRRQLIARPFTECTSLIVNCDKFSILFVRLNHKEQRILHLSINIRCMFKHFEQLSINSFRMIFHYFTPLLPMPRRILLDPFYKHFIKMQLNFRQKKFLLNTHIEICGSFQTFRNSIFYFPYKKVKWLNFKMRQNLGKN